MDTYWLTYVLTYLHTFLLTYLLTYFNYLLICFLTYLIWFFYIIVYILIYLVTCLLTILLPYLLSYCIEELVCGEGFYRLFTVSTLEDAIKNWKILQTIRLEEIKVIIHFSSYPVCLPHTCPRLPYIFITTTGNMSSSYPRIRPFAVAISLSYRTRLSILCRCTRVEGKSLYTQETLSSECLIYEGTL